MTAAKGSASAVSPGEIDRLVAGLHHNPHSLLGAHPVDGGIAIRALRPLATSVTVVLADGRRFPAAHVRQGVFAATLPLAEIPDYRLAVTYPGDADGQADDGTGQAHAGDGTGQVDAGPPVRAGELLVDDPYRHLPTLGEVDLHLIGEGRHEELWRVLGAHVREYSARPAGPADPADPADPAGPSGPASPASPAGLAGPSGPASPASPAGPAGPSGPASPASPAGPAGPSGSASPASPAGPAGPSGPASPASPAGSAGPAAPPPEAAEGSAGAAGEDPFRMAFEQVTGTSFAVWAPNARGVRAIGDFNFWDGRTHPMRSLGGSGVWEIFIPGVGEGTRYKFEICAPDGSWQRKADPMARLAQRPPDTASVVHESRYQWGDGDWLTARARRDQLRRPMSVYEVHLGSWRPGLSYAELADQLTRYVTELGFTHVEFLPVAEHPYGGSWGYQVTSYYAPSARFGTPDEFRALVDRLHQAGIGVVLDWVPAHFPRDSWALARFDGTPLYEHPDPRRGEHPDWGTLIFDYGRPEVRNFLVANALYWLEEFHADGLRVDAVASMLYLDYSRKDGEWAPNAAGGRENLDAVALLREVNATCYRRQPGITMVAEESTAWPGVTQPVHLGGLGFGLKWNMGWMHDTLSYLAHDPVFRTYHHNELTFSMMYAYSENFVLPLSHDEMVHGKGSLLGKMPGDEWRKFAGLRGLFAYMWAHPGKQLIFMGSEFGQAAEWSEQGGLDWTALGGSMQAGLRRLIVDLNGAYRASPALWADDFRPAGFAWIDANDSAGNVVSFLRSADAVDGAGFDSAGARAERDLIACVANFAGEPHLGYRIGLPRAGRWREVINTDAAVYGGSGVGNLGAVEAVAEPWHGLPASAVLAVPPLGVLWLAPEPAEPR